MIEVTRCGHSFKHKPNFQICRPNLSDEYLFIIMKTKAVFSKDGKTCFTKPNTAVLFNIDSYQHYGSYGDIYIDDWIHFKIDKKETDFIKSLNIPYDTPIILVDVSQISDLIYLMTQDQYSHEKNATVILNHYMHILLLKLDEQSNIQPDSIQNHKHFFTFNQLRSELHNTPYKKWTVNEMAEQVNMSPSYFQHIYKELFHLSCMDDLIKIRIEYSKFNLVKSDISIKEVAILCGYENEAHFMRQFKKLTGLTPSQYRSRNISGNATLQ